MRKYKVLRKDDLPVDICAGDVCVAGSGNLVFVDGRGYIISMFATGAWTECHDQEDDLNELAVGENSEA